MTRNNIIMWSSLYKNLLGKCLEPFYKGHRHVYRKTGHGKADKRKVFNAITVCIYMQISYGLS